MTDTPNTTATREYCDGCLQLQLGFCVGYASPSRPECYRPTICPGPVDGDSGNVAEWDRPAAADRCRIGEQAPELDLFGDGEIDVKSETEIQRRRGFLSFPPAAACRDQAAHATEPAAVLPSRRPVRCSGLDRLMVATDGPPPLGQDAPAGCGGPEDGVTECPADRDGRPGRPSGRPAPSARRTACLSADDHDPIVGATRGL